MYSNEEVKWFSQPLMTYKDKFYGTDGYLRVSISTNTEDYKYFNQPLFNISISNNYQKSYNLNFHNASDLLNTLRLVKSQTNGNNSEIQRKYQKNMTLYIQFFIESNNNDSVADIRLLSNETDFTKIIIPIEIFSTFGKCLRYFVDSYFDICTQLLRESIKHESVQIIHQLPSLIKGISSQIISEDTILDSRVPEPDTVEVAKIEATIEDLDNFLGEDMENVIVPELDNNKVKPVVEVDSPFVKVLLKNDLYNLETMINNHMMNPAPIITFAEEVQSKIGPEYKTDVNLLPEMDDHTLNSLVYLSKLYYSLAYMNNFENNTSLPTSTPIFRYKPKKIESYNIDIAYDLLLFNLYIRSVRGRIESKSVDICQNKALFYLQLRCFTDVFVFSFINNNEVKNIAPVINNRYTYYDSIGVFDKYKELLKSMNCPEVKQSDISSSIVELIDKVIGKTINIDEIHANGYEQNNLKISSKNNFSLEQIINEIIPLEIAEKLGKDIKDSTVLKEINNKTPISNEILNFFTKPNTNTKIKKEKKFSNNLQRVINFYSTEIPDKYKEKFFEYIKKLDDSKFDLTLDIFPIDEFGENIIKALYLWDPQNDSQVTKSYKYYQTKIENELMGKELILAKIKSDNTTESSDWDFLSE